MNITELSPEQDQSVVVSGNPQGKEQSPLICSETKTAHHVCLNSNCNQHVFLCDQRSCPCFKKHKGCIKSSIESITEALQQKIISIQPFENRINQLISQAIDSLSLFADEIIDRARQTLDYVGLSENERKFIKIVKNGQKITISSKEMHQIYQSIDNSEQFTNDMLLVEQKINMTWNSLENEMKKSFLTIKKLLNLLTEGGASHIFGGSKIIKKYEERVNLTKFFDRKIKETNLLYRASENNFEVDKFYQNCANIGNTMVVCKTDYNKIIGGFTPNQWVKLQGQEKFYEDSSRQSFVFSLTNNDKFRLLPNCYATKCSPGGGPTFGNTAGLDLTICDKANIYGAMSSVNSAYHNDRYTRGNQNSLEHFSGTKTINFLLKEWEVWHIQFEN